MPATTHDPVHRARYSFEPDGENLWVDTWIEPGGGLPPHWHPSQEEVWRVLDGEVRFQLGSEKRVIGPDDGDMVVKPGTKHGIESVMDRDAHMRCHVEAGAPASGVPRGQRRGGTRGPLHEGRHPARACAARAGRRAS